MSKERFNHLNQYLKQKFGERVLKICVDGGFTCPNRDGSKSTKGCLFCSALGSGEHLKRGEDISTQIQKYLQSYKSERAQKFIVYFQSFSNTYKSIEELEKIYSKALSVSEKIVGIQIATRPDCINPAVTDLLFKLNKRVSVAVELGLQTANETTGQLINRQYTNEDFILAAKMLSSRGIEVIAHMMVGLPGESHEDIIKTLNFLNAQPIKGIKIHSTYVVRGTGLYSMFECGNYTPPSKDEYISELEYILTHLRPDIIIHRLTSDPPKDIFVAPEWNLHKKPILNGIEKIFKEKNLHQGIYYK